MFGVGNTDNTIQKIYLLCQLSYTERTMESIEEYLISLLLPLEESNLQITL